MMVSLEALAMAGASNVDYCGMDIEEWERRELEEYPPPHLLAEEEEENSGITGAISTTSHFLRNNHYTREHENEDYRATFTISHGEKLNRTMQTMSPDQCTRSMKIMARELAMLIMILCYMHKRFRLILGSS